MLWRVIVPVMASAELLLDGIFSWAGTYCLAIQQVKTLVSECTGRIIALFTQLHNFLAGISSSERVSEAVRTNRKTNADTDGWVEISTPVRCVIQKCWCPALIGGK